MITPFEVQECRPQLNFTCVMENITLKDIAIDKRKANYCSYILRFVSPISKLLATLKIMPIKEDAKSIEGTSVFRKMSTFSR